MFSIEYRVHVRERLIDMAKADARIESAAAVGGSAFGEADRWSDIDLTFGLAAGVAMEAVLADWTRAVQREFRALTLFDLPFRSSLYRVFLFPGALQVDLSFTPGAEFGAHGPRFALLFGTAVERETVPPPSPRQLFGLGVHHAVRGRFCMERGRMWQAEYWISSVRDHALMLACLRFGLEPELGRGFDRLPADIQEDATGALVRSLDRDELLRALDSAVAMLLRESDGVHEEAQHLAELLQELLSAQLD